MRWVAILSASVLLSLLGSCSAGMASTPVAEAEASLDPSCTWDDLIGIKENTPEGALEKIIVYSDDGRGLVYPVDDGISNSTGEPGIVIDEPSLCQLSPGATLMEHASFDHDSLLFLVSEDASGVTSTFYEYDSDCSLLEEHEIPFVPTHRSNLWNAYSMVFTSGRLAMVLSDDHEMWMINKRPFSIYDPNMTSVTFTSSLTISNATILGNLLVVDGSFENGSMVIVPTDIGLMAFDIEVVKSELTGNVLDISFGQFRWLGEYLADEVPFEPVVGEHMISFMYPHGAVNGFLMQHIILATEDSRVVAYDRESGEVVWSEHLGSEELSDPILDGVHPSPNYFLVTGSDDGHGFMACLDQSTGTIAYNGTRVCKTEGSILGSPEYVMGRLCYVLSTESDKVYVFDYGLTSHFVYDFSDTGFSCPPSYLGSIYVDSSSAGNYIGVVTETPELKIMPFIEYDGSIDSPDEEETLDTDLLPLVIAVVAISMVGPVVLYFVLRSRRRTHL